MKKIILIRKFDCGLLLYYLHCRKRLADLHQSGMGPSWCSIVWGMVWSILRFLAILETTDFPRFRKFVHTVDDEHDDYKN